MIDSGKQKSILKDKSIKEKSQRVVVTESKHMIDEDIIHKYDDR